MSLLARLVPHCFTLLSLFLGFSSILASIQAVNNLYSHHISEHLENASPQKFLGLAGIFILMSAFLDFLDGFSARLLKSTSEMGKQLDSLVDLVCFGIAPGVLFYTITMMAGSHIPQSGLIYQIQGVVPDYLLPKHFLLQLLAFIFPICAVVRLAKFNVKKPINYFEGAPSTYAGAMVALILTFNFYPTPLTQLLHHYHPSINTILAAGLHHRLENLFSNYFFLLFVYTSLALLMLAPLPFYKLRFLLRRFSSKRALPFSLLLFSMLVLGFKYFLLLFGILYLAASFFLFLRELLKSRKKTLYEP